MLLVAFALIFKALQTFRMSQKVKLNIDLSAGGNISHQNIQAADETQPWESCMFYVLFCDPVS